MKTVSFLAPPDAVASRIRILGPEGEVRLERRASGSESLTTPSDREVLIQNAVPGAYAAMIEPLGEAPTFYPFTVDGDTDTIDAPSMSNLSRASVSSDWMQQFASSSWSKTSRDSTRPGSAMREMGSVSAPDQFSLVPAAGVDFSAALPNPASPMTGAEKADFRDDSQSASSGNDAGPQIAARRFSIGLSVDSRPMGYGGWRPYEGPWPITFSSTPKGSGADEGGASLENVARAWLRIDRSHVALVSSGGDARGMPLPADGARLRLSVSIEGLRVERILIPLFSGGVTIEFALDPSGGLLLNVEPVDLEKQSLARALSSAVGIEGQSVWADFTKRLPVGLYVSGDIPEDPWTAILAMLCAVRFPGVEEHEALQWAPALCNQSPWIPDGHILLARSVLMGAAPDDRVGAADEALRVLSVARRLGAPYFAYANALLGDMLTALRDGAPEERQKIQATKEMGYWSRHLPRQRTAGVSFSWLMSSGARSRGGLDARYSAMLANGSAGVDALSVRLGGQMVG